MRTNPKGAAFAALLILAAVPLRAETGGSAALTFEAALETAARDNPEIAAARKNEESLRAKIAAERSLENPMVEAESMYGGMERTAAVSQMFPFPGKLRARGRVVLREAQMAGQELRAVERRVRSRVKAAYSELLFVQRAIGITNKNAELMRQFSKAAESKYSVGKAGQIDVLRAQVELSKMLNMLVTLQQEKETAQAELNALMNRDPRTPLATADDVAGRKTPLDYEALRETALTGRPELLQARHHVHHTEDRLKLARLDFLPDFTLRYRFRQADSSSLNNTSDFMAGVSVPLWVQRPASTVRSAKLEVEMGRHQIQAERNRTLFELKDRLVKLQTSERLAELYRTSVLPQAEAALKAAQSAYRADRGSFLDLIDTQRGLLQFQLEYYRSLADYQQHLAELERIVGKDL